MTVVNSGLLANPPLDNGDAAPVPAQDYTGSGRDEGTTYATTPGAMPVNIGGALANIGGLIDNVDPSLGTAISQDAAAVAQVATGVGQATNPTQFYWANWLALLGLTPTTALLLGAMLILILYLVLR